MMLAKIAGFIVLVLALGALARKLGSNTAVKNPSDRVAAEINSTAGKPSLTIPGAMDAYYVDRGTQVEIRIIAQGMPILYVDVNKDGTVDPNGADLSYAVYPDGSTCIQRLRLNSEGRPDESAACGSVSSSATVRVSRIGDGWDVVWTIPKQELSLKQESAHVAFQVFREAEQHGDYYPGPLFNEVYQLQFSSPVAMPVVTPAPPLATPTPVSPPTPRSTVSERVEIRRFNLSPRVFQPDQPIILSWEVDHAKQVRVRGLNPNPMIVPSSGSRAIVPAYDTTRIILEAEGEGPGNFVSQKEIIHIAGPQIVEFTSEPNPVSFGDLFKLHWLVSGAKHVRINHPGFDNLPPQGSRAVSTKDLTEFILTYTIRRALLLDLYPSLSRSFPKL